MATTLRSVIVPLLVLATAAGILVGCLWVQEAARMPPFTDPERIEALWIQQPPHLTGPEFQAFASQWHRELAQLQTPKWQRHDRGVSLVVLSLCILVLLALVRPWRRGALAALRCPTPAGFMILAWAVYLSFAPITAGTVWSASERGLLPPWADSVGIPILATILLTLVASPVAGLVILWFARLARRRTGLWVWNPQTPRKSATVTALAAGVMALWFAVLASIMADGPGYALPTLFGIGFLILVARALAIGSTFEDEALRPLETG